MQQNHSQGKTFNLTPAAHSYISTALAKLNNMHLHNKYNEYKNTRTDIVEDALTEIGLKCNKDYSSIIINSKDGLCFQATNENEFLKTLQKKLTDIDTPFRDGYRKVITKNGITNEYEINEGFSAKSNQGNNLYEVFTNRYDLTNELICLIPEPHEAYLLLTSSQLTFIEENLAGKANESSSDLDKMANIIIQLFKKNKSHLQEDDVIVFSKNSNGSNGYSITYKSENDLNFINEKLEPLISLSIQDGIESKNAHEKLSKHSIFNKQSKNILPNPIHSPTKQNISVKC